jgi:hypothetical protein
LKKFIYIFLSVIVLLILACLSPTQHLISSTNHTVKPSIVAENEYVATNNFIITENSKHNYFPELPDFIFIILLNVIISTKFKNHIYSFIPLIKLLYFLFPIKYKSRYLVSFPFI